MTTDKEEKFAVLAEAEGQRQLVMTHLTFARLMDDVVLPYQSDLPFFIDGVPVKRQDLKKLKITKQDDNFDHEFSEVHFVLQRGNAQLQKVYGDQYHVRLEAVFRGTGEDVTSQVIKAFDTKIKPSLKDYLPKRAELISAALTLFTESMKSLSK